MAEQLGSNYFSSPYKFNGKELDEETGYYYYYYYGARYYDPRVSIWLSVDPLAEKFPNWSPYNYCIDNPINMIDADGRAAKPPLKGSSDFNDLVKNVVNTNKGHVINWCDQDGSWSYNAKTQTWVGIGESKGNNISFNKEKSFFDRFKIKNGFTIWGNDRSGDTTGLHGITTDSTTSDLIPHIGGTAEIAGEISALGKLATFISNFCKGFGWGDGVKERVEKVVETSEEAKAEKLKPEAKKYVRTTYYDSRGKETKSELRVKKDNE